MAAFLLNPPESWIQLMIQRILSNDLDEEPDPEIS